MPPPLHLGESTPLANQVAGHDGVMSDASGSLVIKPALAREIAFYQTLSQASRHDQISQLKSFVPQFYGTLRLEGQLSPSGGVDKISGDVPESVVLENLSYSYLHPSILDVKLGTVLSGPDATEEKRARMDKAAKETTSAETGLRLTGCQTWHAPSQSYILTPKSFGKSISATQLPSGMVRFFPLPTDVVAPIVTPPSPPPTSSTTTSSSAPASAHRPAAITPDQPLSIDSSAPSHLPLTPVSATIPKKDYTDHTLSPDLLVRVLDILLEEIDRLVAVLQSLEIRFVGSSILVVYEGDSDRLRAALDRYDEKRLAKERGGTSIPNPVIRSAFSDDGSVNSTSDSEEEADSNDDDDDDDISLDGTREDAKRARRCPPVTVKMIDFAHTWLAEGEGPDSGVLKGLQTLRRLVNGRRAEVRQTLEMALEQTLMTDAKQEDSGSTITSAEI